jgi:hypothetical protein
MKSFSQLVVLAFIAAQVSALPVTLSTNVINYLVGKDVAEAQGEPVVDTALYSLVS